MAVLIQQVVEADYAFVIHTANPITGHRGELYAEVVLGLGETLVGNYPGRALGFVCRKADLGLEVLSYPGKSVGLYGQGVIFRSDSNGEDLEDFAGAGLYDSFLAEEPEVRPLDYTRERLLWDRGFRDDLLRSIARVGIEVERVRGAAQDIEGAVAGGRYYVVQTRPQVGLAEADA
jgi:alpha-glucan,water dikinase